MVVESSYFARNLQNKKPPCNPLANIAGTTRGNNMNTIIKVCGEGLLYTLDFSG